jgi:hypothetical protein
MAISSSASIRKCYQTRLTNRTNNLVHLMVGMNWTSFTDFVTAAESRSFACAMRCWSTECILQTFDAACKAHECNSFPVSSPNVKLITSGLSIFLLAESQIKSKHSRWSGMNRMITVNLEMRILSYVLSHSII